MRYEPQGPASDTYRTAREAELDHLQQFELLTALGCWTRALRRDECGAWTIQGENGCIWTWGDGKSWVLYVGCTSPMAWTHAKKRLAFCEVTQDAAEDGCVRLHQLPTPEQAKVIRKLLGIRKKAEIADSQREALARNAFAAKSGTRGEATFGVVEPQV